MRDAAAEMQQAGKNVLVAGDLNDFEFSAPLATLTQGGVLTNLWYDVPAGQAYSYKFNGHLQTLDHILVTAGMKSRLSDVRYMHLDNDVYERIPSNGTGISDHDPPLATFKLAEGASTSTPGDVSGNVPATLALTLGAPATLRHVRARRDAGLHGLDDRDRDLDGRGRDAERARRELDRHRPARQRHVRARPTRCRSTANNGAFAPLRTDNGPLTLLSWNTPISATNVALGVQAAHRRLRGPAHRGLLQDADVHAVDDAAVRRHGKGRRAAAPRTVPAGSPGSLDRRGLPSRVPDPRRRPRPHRRAPREPARDGRVRGRHRRGRGLRGRRSARPRTSPARSAR